ncbi:MAG: outer membrane beta-barrel protein [Ignavibacteriaceae bacterium]
MRNIFLILLFISLQVKFLIAQQLDIKAGLGFPSIYKADEVNYYRNRLNHEFNPSFILSLRLNWHLTGNLFIAWEPGVVEKSGKITGIAKGFDSLYNDIYGYREYKLWNLENSVLLNYDLLTIKNISVNIYVGSGISWNISEKQSYGESEIPSHPYNDYPYTGDSHNDYSEDPYFNNSGAYLDLGINLQFKKYQLDLRYVKEYSFVRVNSIGRYKSYLFCFLIGYEI